MKRVTSSVKEALNTTPDKLIIVVKIGTSSLVNEQFGTLNLSNLSRVCEVVRELHAKGHYVIIVSSGAVGVGCQRLGLAQRPTKLAQKQALAAIGQAHLMRYYEDILCALGMTCSQVLLTLDNLAERSQYINARNTFTELLAYGTIPVVNENVSHAQLESMCTWHLCSTVTFSADSITINVCLLDGCAAYAGHCGGSRAALWRQ
eukprot:GHRQ01013202.1.p1 GENE.GHRQ01013202.1~~GHRQ01013202.1.p1  ORF type:complete len:204 (+),score=62.82 GHRQ01013202.1:232-843(+)